MPQVKYTGSKPKWFDKNKAPNTVWSGKDDVQTVSDAEWAKLQVHTDILAIEPPKAAPKAAKGNEAQG